MTGYNARAYNGDKIKLWQEEDRYYLRQSKNYKSR